MINLNLFETHDRNQHLIKDQAATVSQGCEDCIYKNELSLVLQQYSSYIYIFVHPRTSDDGLNKRLLWQPRLAKPKAQTNSMLFRKELSSDGIEIVWMIPPREQWSEYKKGNVTEHEIVLYSINMFESNRKLLEDPFPGDLSEEQCKNIYIKVLKELKQEEERKKLFTRPDSLLSSASSSALILDPYKKI